MQRLPILKKEFALKNAPINFIHHGNLLTIVVSSNRWFLHALSLFYYKENKVRNLLETFFYCSFTKPGIPFLLC